MENIKKLKAVANQRRIEILGILQAYSEMNVTELQKNIGLSQSALSQHLAILRKTKLVKTRRESHTIFYSINDKNFVAKILAILGF